jgi:hypothetical protein
MTLLLGNRDVKRGIVPVVRCMTLWRGKYQDQFAGRKNMERTWQNTRTKRNARPLFGARNMYVQVRDHVLLYGSKVRTCLIRRWRSALP